MILIEVTSSRGFTLGYNQEGLLVSRECSVCKEYKSRNEFPKHTQNLGGIHTKCTPCVADYAKNYRKKDNSKARRKVTRAKHKETETRIYKEWVSTNGQKCRQFSRKWRRANKDKCIEYMSSRRSNRREVSKPFKKLLRAFYKECILKKVGESINYHVDHIIPLFHDDVCGLHVPWNLQILPSHENHVKSNKFDGTWENASWKKDL